MKWLHPNSIIGWIIVVLIAALSVSQLATISIIDSMRSDTQEVVEHFHVAERIADIVRVMDATPPAQRAALLAKLTSDTLAVSWRSQPDVQDSDTASWHERLFDDVIEAALWQTPERIHRVALGPVTDVPFAESAGKTRRPSDFNPDGDRRIDRAFARHQQGRVLLTSIALGDDSWLNFRVPIASPPTPGLRTIVAIACSGLIVLALSVWAVRRLTRPLTILAKAAVQLGQDVNAAPLPESGSREMRQAARAFNTMQDRIRRFVTDRMQLIAAISHDLRTPITRLRLRAELAEDEETRRKMKQDLAEMEAMIESTLSFAREEINPEPRLPVDLVSLVESVCEDLPAATVHIAANVPHRLLFECQPLAIRRCLGNLIHNASKYGKRAEVTLSTAPGWVRIEIADRGPGIPEADRERVFEPYLRLDSSRSRDTGGIGLGLTIARATARAHGGDVVLADRSGGGLCATVQLPGPMMASDTGDGS